MLVRSSLPGSTDAGVSSVYDLGKQECDDEHPQQGLLNAVRVTEHKNKNDNLCSSQLSTEVNMPGASVPLVYKRRLIQRKAVAAVLPMSRSSMPTFVYKRRKVQTAFPAQVSTNTTESDNCCTANSFKVITVAGKEHMTSLLHTNNGTLIASDVLPVEHNTSDLSSNSDSVDGAALGEEPIIEEPRSKMQKSLDLRAVNESCSSSKSNMDLGSASLKHQVDDVGECSSSGVPIMEGLGKDISNTNSCISFLRHHGVLEGHLSKKQTDVKNNICCLRMCKVCDQSTTTLKMLICDLCEESFHMSCCNPHIKTVPIGDWFCHSCLAKSGKLPVDDLGPIASMLRDTDPYTSSVRIGKDFQAEVPDWSGPHTDENEYRELMEMSSFECASYQDWGSSKLLRLSSIGNWLQCREVVDDANGTICGKWRRAPLFEIQTDDWECFCCVFWDPAHADCAVRQELETDQVLKQLKYIEMLRPRLSAKKWKLGVDQQEHTGDRRNTRNS